MYTCFHYWNHSLNTAITGPSVRSKHGDIPPTEQIDSAACFNPNESSLKPQPLKQNITPKVPTGVPGSPT